ncbi:MAG: hypothetical protein HZB83_06080, partial [Deltaproteobacteria bacterium]|nr:hypothetical protein [Deltaproteobacteria bacterium]
MKNIVKKLLVLLLATVVAFGIVEALTRLILPPPQDVIVRSVGDFNGDKHVRPKEGSTVYVRTSTGLRLRPNSHAVITNANGAKIDFKTNSLGYRNRELGDKTGPRILFLGDSITAEDRR